MRIDIPTLVTVASITSALVALSLAIGLRTDLGANLGRSSRIWTGGISIQALGWLLIGLRGSIPDFAGFVAGNVAVILGFAECVRALRAFDGRGAARAAYLPVFAVLINSSVFTFVEPSRHWRMVGNSLFLSLIFAYCCLEVLRLEPAGRARPRSHWLVAGNFGFGALMLAGRVVRLAIAGPAPAGSEGLIPMSMVIFYASAAFGPVIATLGFAMMCNDRLDRELAWLATIDPLTGAYNRRSLEQFASREIAQAHRHGHPLALLLIDADHFKSINDEFGHETGDQALRHVTSVLRSCLREVDVLSRLGGEEFVVLMPYADGPAAGAAAERLRAAVEASELDAGSRKLRLTISAGLAEWREGERLADLVRRADRALYRAKEEGRNRVEIAAATAEVVPA